VLSTPPAFVLSQDQTLRECIPVIGTTPRERNRRKEYPACSQRPRCAPPPHNRREDFFKGTSSSKTHAFDRRGINISGVDFWHAVEFSRNGHFLCTHPPTRQAFLRAFPFGFSSLADPISLSATLWRGLPIRFALSRFAFRRFRLYQILSEPIPGRCGVPSGLAALPAIQTLAQSLGGS
jgi:hypothetical protein